MYKVHVWVCGYYCGAYEFTDRDEAIEDMEQRRANFGVLGCRYLCEEPSDP